MVAAFCWSASTDAGHLAAAWVVGFDVGVPFTRPNEVGGTVRGVRSGL